MALTRELSQTVKPYFFKATLTKIQYFKQKLTMYLYKDCSDIPVFNFDVIYRSNDYRYLVVGWDGYAEIEVPKGANERWQEIRNEWSKMIGDNTTYYYYNLVLEVVYLKTRYEQSGLILHRIFQSEMTKEHFEQYLEILEELNYKWNHKATKEDNILRLLKQRKRSLNKISLKEDELEALRDDNNINDEDVASLEKQALIIEQSTGIKIDLRKDSIKKWIEACKIHEDLIEQRRKANGKQL